MQFGEKGIGQISVRGLAGGDHENGKIGAASAHVNGNLIQLGQRNGVREDHQVKRLASYQVKSLLRAQHHSHQVAGGDENGMAHSRDDRVVFDVEKAGLALQRSFHFLVGIGRAKYSASEGGRKASDITMISIKIREKWCSSIASLRIRESRDAAGCKTSPPVVHSSHLKNRRSHTARR